MKQLNQFFNQSIKKHIMKKHLTFLTAFVLFSATVMVNAHLNPDGSIDITNNGGVDADGVPNLVNSGGIADIGGDQGQGVGDSRDANISVACASDENCYIPITGNDFTWYNISSGFEQWDYYNHHNGWGSIVNSWNSGNIDAPEAGSPLEIYRATTTQPGTTGGFVFDIYAMDNSFNMEINGTKLANQELQFQFDTADQTPGNVQFADGTYPGNGMPQIWELYGDKQSGKPVIRIIIDAAGQAKLYGSKASYDSPAYLLEEMQLTNGNTFNPVTWNETTTNEVIISQLIASTTMMVGNGYGIKKVSCEPCTQQGATGAPDGFTKIGISTMKSQSAGWPENIANGWITMDSKTKGFVITRVQNQSSIADPKEGMLIYDIDAACVKLYNGFGWNCIEKSCNE